MIKRILFVTLVLAISLWSCSQSDDVNNPTDDYVDVTLGTESDRLKSIVIPGGGTSWDTTDKVEVLDVDGVIQTFAYANETPKSSAEFKGKLKGGQGKKIYKAYHAATNSNTTLKDGHILVTKRKDITIESDDMMKNSAIFGLYCPMVGIPFEFDAGSKKGSLVQFYHLNTMIEGRVTLRESLDKEHLDKTFDKVVFELQATDSEPFHTIMEFDMDKLTTSSIAEDLNKCIIDLGADAVKTDYMSTTMNMKERTIRSLMEEYSQSTFFPIPIFALPTNDKFAYRATICFYHKNTLQLKMSGTGEAKGLYPVGSNPLNFDHGKIVNN
ncbi:MAG: hypothetical protein E6767_13455 [Dysgonomonas sp.]|nr:hypothetical protein [Dysgonomonas sp.]